MRKRIIVGTIAAVAIGGTALAVADSSERRTPASKAALKSVEKDLGKAKRGLRQAQAARVRCRSIGCVNRNLNKLAGSVSVLQNDVAVLKHDAFDCEQLVNVTRYDGYVYSPDAGATLFTTSALDITTPGDPVTARAVIYVC
jgi:hypothetical protein